jgi:epoxyqueuosine reductase
MDSTELIKNLASCGYQARAVNIGRAKELASGIEELNRQGLFDPEFYDRYIAKYLNFDFASVLPGAKSIVVTAAFQPPARVRFGTRSLTIPPTYIYRDIWEGSLKTMTELLTPHGYKVARARLPLKTLAVKSGLGRYGRNNICYIPGMGSFHRLGAFYTDMPCPTDEWQEPLAMESCQKCSLCQRICPTGAILPDRFLINANRCLTYVNENEEDFPAWVKTEWHNAVLGCMECQQVCPVDKNLLSQTVESPVSFEDNEVGLLLRKTPLTELPEETRRKLHELCLDDDYALLARNIGCLIK